MIRYKQITAVWMLIYLVFAYAVLAVENTSAAQGKSIAINTDATYQLGDIGPNGGKIFFVDTTGQHGLEAQSIDENGLFIWSDAVIVAKAYGNGWHLPTKFELKILYEQRKVVSGFVNDDYWSSSELDINSAWIQGFLNGDQDRYNKYSSLRVRAVCAF